jgi:hypothetical protein
LVVVVDQFLYSKELLLEVRVALGCLVAEQEL